MLVKSATKYFTLEVLRQPTNVNELIVSQCCRKHDRVYFDGFYAFFRKPVVVPVGEYQRNAMVQTIPTGKALCIVLGDAFTYSPIAYFLIL